MSQLSILNKCDENSNFWIVNISPNFIKPVIEKNIFGALTKNSRNINKFRPNDLIFLCSKFDNQYKLLAFSMVEEIQVNSKKLFNHFLSDKKVKFKSVKYFENPIVVNSIQEEINIKNLSKKEFLEISEEDVVTLLKKEKLSNEKPMNLLKVPLNLEEFLLNTLKVTYEFTIDKSEKQYDIHEFIKRWHEIINMIGINESIDILEKFYSRNVWQLNYKHVPSRDPDKNILLYDGKGKSKNFGYIILN